MGSTGQNVKLRDGMTTDDIGSASNQKSAPALGYGGISGILIGESQKFFQRVLTAGTTTGTTKISDDFLAAFLIHADEFSAQCCLRLAQTLKESSRLPDIRATPDAVLIRLVRSRTFETLDCCLAEFVQAAKSWGILSKVNPGQLAESRVRDAALESGARPSADSDGRQVRSLTPQAGRTEALVQAFNYLNRMDGLAHDFLDYGGGKLLGSDADYNMMNEFAQNVRDSIQPDASEVLAYFEKFDAVRKRKWEELRAAETEAIRSVALQATHLRSQKSGGFLSLAFGVLCAGPIWVVLANGITNRIVLGTAVGIGLLGVFFFFRGIFKLTNG